MDTVMWSPQQHYGVAPGSDSPRRGPVPGWGSAEPDPEPEPAGGGDGAADPAGKRMGSFIYEKPDPEKIAAARIQSQYRIHRLSLENMIEDSVPGPTGAATLFGVSWSLKGVENLSPDRVDPGK